MEQLSLMEQFLIHGVRFLLHTAFMFYVFKFHWSSWRRDAIKEFRREIILRLQELNLGRDSYEEYILEKEWDGMGEERKTKAEEIQSKFISHLIKKEWDEIKDDNNFVKYHCLGIDIEGGLVVDRDRVKVDKTCILLKLVYFILQYHLLVLIPYVFVLVSGFFEWSSWVIFGGSLSVSIVFLAIAKLITLRPK